MKTSQLFWGFFLITIGSLYLLEKYIVIAIDWHFVWSLWPVIIIFAGLALVLKGTFVKPVINILFGILMALLVFGFFNDTFDGINKFHKHELSSDDISKNTYDVEYSGNISHVNLTFNAGAGSFYINGTTDKLIHGFAKGNIKDYSVENNQTDSIAWVNINLEHKGKSFFKGKNQFELKLNKKPTWNLNFNIGAAKSNFDLRPFKVKNLVVNTGAAKTKIKLGDKTDLTYVNIEMGAAALIFYIPETSGCKVKRDMILMSKKLEGFDKTDSGYYITNNYETAKNKIIIDIDGGVSSFKIKRY
jgi:hypothetical protein